jgi:rhodanese-related sulfurtransferase
LPKDHFSKTRIPGAINIPEQDDDFVERVSSAVGDDLNAEIIVYCASSECDSSTNAAQKLDSAGFTNVYEYEGGAKDWQRASPSPQMSG